jgi:hypothetical protein
VQNIIISSVDADVSHNILDALSRVSASIKRGPAGSAAVQPGADADSFTTHLRPTLIDMFKLLHGVVSDSAVMWANNVAERHRVKEAETAAAKGTEKKGWFK